MSSNLIPNVIVFGETGVGKSSLVNLILGREQAQISPDAEGCTFSNTCYEVSIKGNKYNLYDTAGLNEGAHGTVAGGKAIANLYYLVRSIADTGGVSLLVFVIKCGRLTENIQKNYNLFYNAFCESQVPIIIVITGCENIEPMDSWWSNNKQTFEDAGMVFQGHACVCTYRGRMITPEIYSNGQPFEESKGKVESLIPTLCLSTGWKKSPIGWFQRILNFYLDIISWTAKIPAAYKSLYDRLLRSHSDDEATNVIDQIKKVA